MNWIDTILKILMPFVTASAGYLFSRLQQTRQRDDLVEEGLTAILRIKLIEQHDKWVEKKVIPFYALENWDKMFDIYQKLGGNGVVAQMDKEIHTLPVNQ